MMICHCGKTYLNLQRETKTRTVHPPLMSHVSLLPRVQPTVLVL